MSEIIVKRISSWELTREQIMQLLSIYKAQYGDFVILFSAKNKILYVNRCMPDESIERVLRVLNYKGETINEEGCEVYSDVKYLYEKYGETTYFILMDGVRRLREERLYKRAQEITPAVVQNIKEYRMGDECNSFPEHLVYLVADSARKLSSRTLYNKVSMGTEYVFYLGYLMGQGIINVDN